MTTKYLSKKELALLVEAIKSAENQSTGEIRVHIDSSSETNNAKTAFQVFQKLEMYKTAERNAVLFHINFEQKYLTIIGDEGIHKCVKQKFWNDLHDEITQYFANGIYFEAIKNAILKTGLELKKYFPVLGSNKNELTNEISFS